MNPFEAAPKNKKMLVIAGLYVGMFAMVMLSASFSTIVPEAAKEIGGMEIFPLASSLGGVLSTVGMPLYAYFGTKNPMLIRPLAALGILVGAVSAIIMALAPSMWVIIIGNFFVGFLAMGLYALGYPWVRHMFGQVKSGIYLGIFGTVTGVGMLVGPLLVSGVLAAGGWRACFWILVPLNVLSALLIFLGPRITQEQSDSIATKVGSFDWLGAFAMSALLAGFVLALSLGLTTFAPFGSAPNFILLALFVIGLVLTIYDVRKKGDAGLIPLSALRDHNVKSFFFCNFLNLFAIMGAFFFLPTYILQVMPSRDVLPIDPAIAPFFALLSIAAYSVLPIILGGPLGKLAGKTGTVKTIHAVGVAVRIVVNIALIIALLASADIIIILVLMFVSGIYSATQNCSFAVGPMIQLKPELMVQGNSMIALGQNFGSTVGLVVYTMLLLQFGYVLGFPIALGVGVGLSVISLIVGLTFKRLEAPAAK
jgi:MFS family permease